VVLRLNAESRSRRLPDLDLVDIARQRNWRAALAAMIRKAGTAHTRGLPGARQSIAQRAVRALARLPIDTRWLKQQV
jgi:hypothetical protein